MSTELFFTFTWFRMVDVFFVITPSLLLLISFVVVVVVFIESGGAGSGTNRSSVRPWSCCWFELVVWLPRNPLRSLARARRLALGSSFSRPRLEWFAPIFFFNFFFFNFVQKPLLHLTYTRARVCVYILCLNLLSLSLIRLLYRWRCDEMWWFIVEIWRFLFLFLLLSAIKN